jgi:hypothetical protein
MSKRKSGDHPRIDKDHYPTPLKPVRYLIQYLQRDNIKAFVEPCCGPGECLIRHLESFGLSCVYRGDIIFGQDALQLTKAMCRGAPIISNLPFRYPEGGPKDKTKLLRDLLQHFFDIDVPSWLLMPHDFATNEYAPPSEALHRHRGCGPGEVDRGLSTTAVLIIPAGTASTSTTTASPSFITIASGSARATASGSAVAPRSAR